MYGALNVDTVCVLRVKTPVDYQCHRRPPRPSQSVAAPVSVFFPLEMDFASLNVLQSCLCWRRGRYFVPLLSSGVSHTGALWFVSCSVPRRLAVSIWES